MALTAQQIAEQLKEQNKQNFNAATMNAALQMRMTMQERFLHDMDDLMRSLRLLKQGAKDDDGPLQAKKAELAPTYTPFKEKKEEKQIDHLKELCDILEDYEKQSAAIDEQHNQAQNQVLAQNGALNPDAKIASDQHDLITRVKKPTDITFTPEQQAKKSELTNDIKTRIDRDYAATEPNPKQAAVRNQMHEHAPVLAAVLALSASGIKLKGSIIDELLVLEFSKGSEQYDLAKQTIQKAQPHMNALNNMTPSAAAELDEGLMTRIGNSLNRLFGAAGESRPEATITAQSSPGMH